MQHRRSVLFSILAAFGLSACNVSTPFDGPMVNETPGETVVVGLTHAVIRDNRAARSLFFDYVEEVEASLPQNPGYLGFSKRLNVLGNDAWTMSVWTDQKSMEAFVRSETHQRAIRNAFGALTSARFARIEVPAQDAPLAWEEALKVLESDGATY